MEDCQENAYDSSTCTLDTTPLVDKVGTETNYQGLDNMDLKRVFNKYVVSDGVVTEAYSCAIYSYLSNPVCLRGGNSSFYSANRGMIEGLATTFSSYGTTCFINNSSSSCEGAQGLVLYAYSSAEVDTAGDSIDGNCYITSDRVAYCEGVLE